MPRSSVPPTRSISATSYARFPRASTRPCRSAAQHLSTGQKQLISFARALAHRPEILILDEATSSVDTDTELRVRSALERMIVGRTSVVIAHRLSTIQRADTILVMHKGKLRESGTHNQLLAERGLYWRLYRLQYKDQEDTIVPIPAEPLPPATRRLTHHAKPPYFRADIMSAAKVPHALCGASALSVSGRKLRAAVADGACRDRSLRSG